MSGGMMKKSYVENASRVHTTRTLTQALSDRRVGF